MVNEIGGVPVVPWEEFYTTLDWKQGEHVSVFGRTGSGKTFMTSDLLNIRSGYTIGFGVKPEDESLDYLIDHEGYTRLTSWPPKPRDPSERRFILWPHLDEIDDLDKHESLYRRALGEVYAQRGWTIFVDEVRYMSQRMGMARELGDIWILGRSSHLTLVGCTQRPAWVPLEMLTQATHVFLYQTSGEEDIKRLRAIDVRSRDSIIAIVSALPAFHCLYVNTVTGELLVTKADKR